MRPFRSLLQALEAGLPAGERDDLAVEHELRRRVGGERRRDLGKARVEAQVVAREQAHLAVALDRDAADAVELSFEQPGRVGEALLGQDGLHRLDALRQRGRAQQRALVAGEPREGVTGRRSHLGIVCAWFAYATRVQVPVRIAPRWLQASVPPTGASVSVSPLTDHV